MGQLEKEHRQVLWVTEGVVSGTHYNNDDKNNDITNRGNFPPHNFLLLQSLMPEESQSWKN